MKMNFCISVLFIHVIYGISCEGRYQVELNPIYDIKEYRNDYQQNIVCKNQSKNIVAVHTATDRRFGTSTYIGEQLLVVVHYRCPTYLYKSNPEIAIDSYQQVCIGTEDKIGLNVDLRILDQVKIIRIETIRCFDEYAMFRLFENNSLIDFTDSDRYIFAINTSKISPTKMTVSRMFKKVETDIIFNITRSKCAYGWHEENRFGNGYKCFIKVNNINKEGGYKMLSCSLNVPDRKKENYTVSDLCEYYKRTGTHVCKNLCFNMPNCGYLCATENDLDLIEGGYVMIGDGGHSRKINTLVDECSYNMGVCEEGNEYCVDKYNAFNCTRGRVNMTNCIAGKTKIEYWRCPVDLSVFDKPNLLENKSVAISFKKDIIDKYKKNAESKTEIKEMLTVLENLTPNRTNVTFNLPAEEKRNLASFLLDRFVNEYSNFSNNKKDVSFHSDVFKFSTREVNFTESVESIQMLEPDEESEEYVQLDVNRPKMDANQTLKANCFLFQKFDVMAERETVKNIFDDVASLKDIDVMPTDSILSNLQHGLYKNSEMFNVQVNTADAVSRVSYNLNATVEMKRTSWLYEIEDKCGVLDKTKNWTWTTDGCKLTRNLNGSICVCNHLSNFARLISIKKVNTSHLLALQVLSIIGGIVNMVSLLLFVFFVLMINSEKLRIDLLNIAVCMLLGTFLFLCGPLFVKSPKLCSIAALTTQFLFLSAFMWKLILGISVFQMMSGSRHQITDYIVKYKWTLHAVTYSVPLVIVTVFGSVYWRYYGAVADNLCWIDASSKGFLSFIIPISIVMALNTVSISFVGYKLYQNYVNVHKTRISEFSELMVFIQLFVSMGLTWLPAYFSMISVVAMYIFVLFYPMQGLLMFLLIVIVNKVNREKVSSFIINNYSSIRTVSTRESNKKERPQSKNSNQSKVIEETEACKQLLTNGIKSESTEEQNTIDDVATMPDVYVTRC